VTKVIRNRRAVRHIHVKTKAKFSATTTGTDPGNRAPLFRNNKFDKGSTQIPKTYSSAPDHRASQSKGKAWGMYGSRHRKEGLRITESVSEENVDIITDAGRHGTI
jgi:hypothetical protein